MPLYGYARVSTFDQDLSIQSAALKAVGYEVIRAAKASGARRAGRTELQVLLVFFAPGDTLVVTRIDRLARSLKDLQDIVHELKNRGVALKAPNSRRYRHGSGQGIPRHAGSVRRISKPICAVNAGWRDQCPKGARCL
jgi:DNA invertase Pin-like site-specific DNA recombinase